MNGKPKLLDLFCKAGGAAMGYHRAGFEVVGVDIEPQPHYPFEFHLADALTYSLEGFDAYHASPPCQGYSICKNFMKHEYPRLIDIVRTRLISTGAPYVIENVMGARKYMRNPLMLCGTMFGLKTIRHRLFETHPPIYFPPAACAHQYRTAKQGYAPKENEYACVVGNCAGIAFSQKAMGIDWMRRGELSQAVPPAYTEYIGKFMMREISQRRSCGCFERPD